MTVKTGWGKVKKIQRRCREECGLCVNAVEECDPSEVELSDYEQWRDEEGYWVGEYTFYGPDGKPNVSSNWNYPYDNYKGFITGKVEGNAYRQRNVFLYPPQTTETCSTVSDGVVGDGECGVNGNTKVFFADQNATTCSTNVELGGDISGPFGAFFDTTTELVGRENALLYQVWLKKEVFGLPEDLIYQSQLTTITANGNRRTRTAQGFDVFDPTNIGNPTYASFYREKKVTKDEFYAELRATLTEYNILESDTCAWQNGPTGAPEASPYTPGFDSCEEHLESGLEINDEMLRHLLFHHQ